MCKLTKNRFNKRIKRRRMSFSRRSYVFCGPCGLRCRCGWRPFAFQKAVFCVVKGHLLQRERWPFVTHWLPVRYGVARLTAVLRPDAPPPKAVGACGEVGENAADSCLLSAVACVKRWLSPLIAVGGDSVRFVKRSIKLLKFGTTSGFFYYLCRRILKTAVV